MNRQKKTIVTDGLDEEYVINALKGELALYPGKDQYDIETNNWSYGLVASIALGQDNFEVTLSFEGEYIVILEVIYLDVQFDRFVGKVMEEQGLGVEELARRAGVFPDEILRWQSGEDEIVPARGARVAWALGIDYQRAMEFNGGMLVHKRKTTDELTRSVKMAIDNENYRFSDRASAFLSEASLAESLIVDRLKGNFIHQSSMDQYGNFYRWQHPLISVDENGESKIKIVVELDEQGTLWVVEVVMITKSLFWDVISKRMNRTKYLY